MISNHKQVAFKKTIIQKCIKQAHKIIAYMDPSKLDLICINMPPITNWSHVIAYDE
jgi:hypothetical protein